MEASGSRGGAADPSGPQAGRPRQQPRFLWPLVRCGRKPAVPFNVTLGMRVILEPGLGQAAR